MPDMTTEELADAMYKMIKDAQGMKKYKATDLHKAMVERHGVDKKACKAAIRTLVDSQRCIYTYFGSSCIEIPPEEGGEN